MLTAIIANLIIGPILVIGGIVIIRFRAPLNRMVHQQQKQMFGRRAADAFAGRQRPWMLGIVGVMVICMGLFALAGPLVVLAGGGTEFLGPVDGGAVEAKGPNTMFATVAPFILCGGAAFMAGWALIAFRRPVYEFFDQKVRAKHPSSEVNEFARTHRPALIALVGTLVMVCGAILLVTAATLALT